MDRLVSKAEHILAGTAHDEHPDMHQEHPAAANLSQDSEVFSSDSQNDIK